MEDRAHEGGNDDERREYPRENRSEQRKIEKVRPTLQAGYVIPEIGLGDISLGDAVRELRPIDHAVDPRNQYSGAATLPIIRDSWSIRSKSFISMSVKALSSTKPQLENDAGRRARQPITIDYENLEASTMQQSSSEMSGYGNAPISHQVCAGLNAGQARAQDRVQNL